VGSPRVTSGNDEDDETEDILPDDISLAETSRAAIPATQSQPATPAIARRTPNLKNPGREKVIQQSAPVKDNPRKRRRSELFTPSQRKESVPVLPHVPPSPFSPKPNDPLPPSHASPPRPPILIPTGLTRVESPNRIILPTGESLPPKEDVGFDEGGGRRVSRARKQVNYALPNLKDKMRREDPPERNRGRSTSHDRSVTPEHPVPARGW
jgi:Shugoshin C terminus